MEIQAQMLLGFICLGLLHFLPGPNKLRQELSDRLAALERAHNALELKVVGEHPRFLEMLSNLQEKLAGNTKALEKLGEEFHAFARTFRSRTGGS